MASKKDEKSTIASSKTPVEKHEAAKAEMAPKEDKAMNSVMNRLSQQFNLLTILIVALFLFQAYTFYQVKDIQTNGTVAGAGAGADAESPLSAEKLLAYAEELDLDKGAFEQCLASEETASVVTADTEQASSLSVQGTPGFFINGKFLGGAFPFETFKEIIDKEIDGTATTNCADYSEELQTYCSDPATASFKPEPVEVKVNNSPIKGSRESKVIIIEFSDFECPFCARGYATVKQIQEAYPNDVAIVYKHLPLTQIHPNAVPAAKASVCAGEQGKFWEYHDVLFEAQGAV